MSQRKKSPDNEISIKNCQNCPFFRIEPVKHCFLFSGTPMLGFKTDPKPDFCNYVRVDLIEEGGGAES